MHEDGHSLKKTKIQSAAFENGSAIKLYINQQSPIPYEQVKLYIL